MEKWDWTSSITKKGFRTFGCAGRTCTNRTQKGAFCGFLRISLHKSLSIKYVGWSSDLIND